MSKIDFRDPHRQFAIESGIPIAPRNAGKSKYPFLAMEVGDSFAFQAEEIERVRSIVTIMNKKHAPMRFSASLPLRRVWRTA